MTYNTSSQVRSWIFNKHTIAECREQANKSYVDAVDTSDASVKDNMLSAEEEQQLLFYYKSKMIEFGQQSELKLPDTVYSTAIAYMNRFYLKKSVMDVNPKQMMKVCLFIACKTEDDHREIGDYSNVVKIQPKEIVEMEIPLLEALAFQLVVYHPFRPLYGFLLDINEMMTMSNNQYQTWLNASTFSFNDLYHEATKHIQRSLLTDCSFLYHPYLIALACLDLSWPAFHEYFKLKFLSLENHVQIQKEINEVKAIINAVPERPNIDQVKIIDAKLISLSKSLKKSKTKKKKSSASSSQGSTKKQRTDLQSPPPPTDAVAQPVNGGTQVS
ncbi:hypothetical protein SAMD00019534_111540 [Acytostelium subglobosum LB1]|uniref:hypothetical protein n=1 Tax=Acytostelium subglobosum LB1 TaxID=1410327 RepID=UPI000644E7A7|nr:hypothetical protein SAMD00019534_111540 [Acytostelium subglobosum LB1]GAM27978.1 hypothetical protein SAMD00019534_111540 [Acytostelium subglobosum LB1]|eukprot:XP_012748937.1 hypothetical protein SAMD00019534_111540 [Acytostelium subglobosum LB1]